MAYINKKISGLLNTRITDLGRKKISQGNFNIKYFLLGDSEVIYGDDIVQKDMKVMEPSFGAANMDPDVLNKTSIKYPIMKITNGKKMFGTGDITIRKDLVYNTAKLRGTFIGEPGSWSANTGYGYVRTPNYIASISSMGSNILHLVTDICDNFIEPTPFDCCEPTPTPTQPGPPTPTPTLACDDPQPDPPPTPEPGIGVPEIGDMVVIYFDCCGDCGKVRNGYTVLTYRICGINEAGTQIALDRDLPDLASLNFSGDVRIMIYPSSMEDLYGVFTPNPIIDEDLINFENPCEISDGNPNIWNMAIPWAHDPAGLSGTTHLDFAGSVHLGTMNYLGYIESTGQSFNGDLTDTSYFNSFYEQIPVMPEEQKCVALIHYTNSSLDLVYGEKFAMGNYDPDLPGNTGQARNFRLELPTLLWHKKKDGTSGQVFYVDPPGYDGFEVNYMTSGINSNMNDPGLRYFHLWDDNPGPDGIPNRVGKVFPDHKLIVIDDEEICAAMSHKSNRNWTIPAPKLTLTDPGLCSGNEPDGGVLSGDTQLLWLTYRLGNTTNGAFTESLHCNYYTKIVGPSSACTMTAQDICIKFGGEFPFLNTPGTGCTYGFFADSMELIFQITALDEYPDPLGWSSVDVTGDVVSGGGYITSSGLTTTTFFITAADVAAATPYVIDYIDLPGPDNDNCLNFGDETLFHGNVRTDIASTIYEMNYAVNLPAQEFNTSTNPTHISGMDPYISEIGLYDNEKNLMIITKLQTPQRRRGEQQFLIKLDL